MNPTGGTRTGSQRLQTNHRIQTPKTTLPQWNLRSPKPDPPPHFPRRNLPPSRPLLQCHLQIHNGTPRRIQWYQHMADHHLLRMGVQSACFRERGIGSEQRVSGLGFASALSSDGTDVFEKNILYEVFWGWCRGECWGEGFVKEQPCRV